MPTNEDILDNILESHTSPKLTRQEVKHVARPTASKEIGLIIKKKLPTKKSQGPDGFMGESYQIFKELTPILHKLF